MEALTNLPPPVKGSREEVANGIIDEILNCMLNRHIHLLEENGYIVREKYRADCGWDGPVKKKALRLKHELMDEAQTRFRRRLAEALKEPASST